MPRTVSLAEPAARWIDDRVAAGDAPDADTYVAELIEREREEAEKLAALHAALDEGEASGVSDKNFERIVAEALEAHKDEAAWRNFGNEGDAALKW